MTETKWLEFLQIQVLAYEDVEKADVLLAQLVKKSQKRGGASL